MLLFDINHNFNYHLTPYLYDINHYFTYHLNAIFLFHEHFTYSLTVTLNSITSLIF